MSLRRLWATTRLDLAHNVRRPLFWIWLLILALTAWGFSGGNMRIQSGDSDVGGVKAFITSEFAIAQIMTVLILLFHAFFIAVGSGMSVLRDEELQVGPVLHATPLSPSEYVWGKFLAVLISFVVVLGLHIGLMAFFNHLMTGAEESEFIGPFVLGNYLRPALIFALPTVVFLAGVTFWVGERFKRPILVFFLPVAMLMACVFFLWSWSPTWLPQPVNRLLMFLDPSGQRWLQETWLKVDKGAEFYNTSAIGLDGVLIWSRLLLVTIGILGVVLASHHFSATLRGKPRRSSRASFDQDSALEEALAAHEDSGPAQAPVVPAALGALGMRSGRPGFFSGLSAVTRIEFRELIHSPGLYLFIPLIVLETMGGAMLNTGAFDTTPLLTPGTMAVGGMGILTGFVCLLLLFYTVESLRREEGTGLASIHHSTPVRTASILSGKALANALVGVVTIAASLLTSLVILSITSSVAIELWPFILVWCVILLPTFLLWSTFVSFLYSLVRNRYTTYALALGAMMWTGYESQTGGLSWVWNWPLWGTLQWSDMGVFELVRGELFFNRLLALTVTVFFTVLTVRLFPRRQSDSTNVLLRLRPLSLLKNTLKLSPVIIPPIVVGVMLAGRIDAGFQGDQRTKAAKDYWRKNVATWTDADIPDLVDVQLELELFPQRRSFEARGTYTLSNEHDHDLAVIPITSGAGWRRPDSLPDPLPGEDVSEAPLWFLDGEPFEPEDAAGLMLFRLPQPLAPGGELTLGFHHSGEVPSGATENGGGNMEFILPSGVVLGSFSPTIVPGIGYNPGIGVDEDNSSDAKEFPDDHYLGVTRSLFGGTFAPFPVSMRVTAPEEYRINGVGVLKSDEVVDGKRTVLWETDSPVRFFNVVAGRWTEARGKEGTAIYHHPEHTYNIEVMLEALDGARKYYSEWFFPYPWEELKISEFPALAGYAQGFPTNITFSEGIGFLTKEGKEIASAPFMVTAHESAHQWWGNILTPGEGPGGNLLSEGMAHFSTLLLFEQIRGIEARIAFAKMIESQYGDRRVKDSERPLVKIDGSRPGDTTVTYDKAGWVFWMLLNHMGRENCLSGIQSFIAHYESNRDHPLLQDYIAHLRPFAPDAETYDAFVQQWFLDVVVPQYEFEDVQKVGDPESGWTVTLTVTNTGTGVMPVEVVASAGERFPKEEDESTDSSANSQEAVPGPGEVLAAEIEDADEPVYRSASVTVTLGPDESAEVVIECPFEPQRVVIDPDALVLMLGRKHAIEEL